MSEEKAASEKSGAAFEMSGSPVVRDNTGKDGVGNNVFLNGNTMSVSAPLSEDAQTGVTMKTNPAENAPAAESTELYQVSFRLTPAGNEKYIVSPDSVTEAESIVKLHSFGGRKITKPAPEQETGLKERTCEACGYKQTETIPKTDGGLPAPGKIETDKEQGKNTPDTTFGTSKETLASVVPTPEEQSLAEAGTGRKFPRPMGKSELSLPYRTA